MPSSAFSSKEDLVKDLPKTTPVSGSGHRNYLDLTEKIARSTIYAGKNEAAVANPDTTRRLRSKKKTDFMGMPWDSYDKKFEKMFSLDNPMPPMELPYAYRRVLAQKNPAERKADDLLEAVNSGLFTADEINKIYNDLKNENQRLKRQFRQQLNPTHITDSDNLQTLPLSFEEKRMYEKSIQDQVLKQGTISNAMSSFRKKSNGKDVNLLSRITWPLSSELPFLEQKERDGILSVYEHYTHKHKWLSDNVKEKLKEIDMDPIMTDAQKHIRARDLIASYRFNVFEDKHKEYRNDYMGYLTVRQNLIRDRLGLPNAGGAAGTFTVVVTKTDELHDFAKTRNFSRAVPSPRLAAKTGAAAVAEFNRVWNMDNMDNNVLNKRLRGHFSRQFRNHLHRRRVNRRWLKKMIPKTYRVAQIYRYYLKDAMRRLK